jgi:hypothetical protein
MSSVEWVTHRIVHLVSGKTLLYSVSDKDRVYILTSFIDAHQHAQETIVLYLGENEGVSTPEEALVVAESVSIVLEATKELSKINVQTLSLNVTRQAAHMVLHAADDLIVQFIEEGTYTLITYLAVSCNINAK